MPALLLPLSLFVKSFNHTLPTLIQTLPVYVFIILFGIKLVQNYRSVLNVPYNSTVIIWMAVLLLVQLVMITYSYAITDKKAFTSGLTTGPVNTFLFFANIFLVYTIVYLIIDSIHAEQLFFKSLLITLIIFLSVVLIPQVIGTSSTRIDGWINFIGRHFENHHRGRVDFYHNGSYTTTLRRVNGFEPEAAFLAALLGIIFVPPILASIKNEFNLLTGKVTKKMGILWLLLMALVITLFFAKTSTGFLVIGLIGVSMFFVIPKRSKKMLLFVYVALAIIIVLAYLFSPYVQFILNKYVIAKQGTDNRMGGTIAAFKTFLTHPLFGVGSGYTSYYYFKYVPQTTIHNFEYEHVFLKTGYPDLSILGSVLASYGMLGVGAFTVFLGNKVKLSKKIMKKMQSDLSENAIFVKTIIDSFYFYLLFFIILSIFTFQWTDEIYLLMLMVYLQVIRRAKSVYLS